MAFLYVVTCLRFSRCSQDSKKICIRSVVSKNIDFPSVVCGSSLNSCIHANNTGEPLGLRSVWSRGLWFHIITKIQKDACKRNIVRNSFHFQMCRSCLNSCLHNNTTTEVVGCFFILSHGEGLKVFPRFKNDAYAKYRIKD